MSSTCRSSISTALASAALSAALVFALAPGRLEARAGARRHAARTADVDFDTALAREAEGARWSIGVSAVNASAARRCNVKVSLNRTPASAMFSRVARPPTPVWSTFVALEVPARAEAKKSVELPAKVARQLEAERKGRAAEGESAFGTSATAECSPTSDAVG